MKSLTVVFTFSFAVCMLGNAWGQETGNKPQQANNFRDQLKSGQWITLVQERDGYRVHIMKAKPEIKEVSVSDVNLRYAHAVHKLASSEYEQSVEANKTKPGSISEPELGRLKLELERASLQVELSREEVARERSEMSRRESIQQILEIGADFVAMRNDNIETFIPMRLIRTITRDLSPIPKADDQTNVKNQLQKERDREYRSIGEVVIANVLLRAHWQGLETNKDFRQVVQTLNDDFTPDQRQWGALRPAANNSKDDQSPRNDFEKNLLKRWSDIKKPGDSSIQTTPKEIWFYQPVYLSAQSCVVCHRVTNPNEELDEGDLQAIIRVRLAANPGAKILDIDR